MHYANIHVRFEDKNEKPTQFAEKCTFHRMYRLTMGSLRLLSSVRSE